MRVVAFPIGKGWHYANVDEIIAIKYVGPGRSFIYLTGGIELECSEDTYNVIKRIEAALTKTSVPL